MTERVGQQLGNYHILRLLGRGGFAEVYLGEHVYLKTQAAIKVLQTRLANEDREGFYAEARTIAHLQHDHIVGVLEFGVGGNMPYLVMEYAPNGTLRQRHPRGTLVPLADIVSYVKQAGDALQYAHNEKLIHRDIKPENMLLGANNELLLSDFGIALVLKSSRYQDKQEVVGTVAYMAPEQLKGQPRPASDQYALGTVVYEWLCGDRPFHGSFTEIASQHVFTPPPPLHERISTISPAVEEIVLKALAKDPQKRFASVQDFAHALEQAGVGTAPTSDQSLAQASTQSPLAEMQMYAAAHLPSAPSSKPASPSQEPPLQPLSTPQKTQPLRTLPMRMKVLLLALILLIVIGGSGLAYYLFALRSAQSSGQANSAQARAAALQEMYRQATSGTPVLDDPLHTESIIGWDRFGLCTFKGEALHANKLDIANESFCIALTTNFSNFAYQVQATIIKGATGGFLFRYDLAKNSFYTFFITSEGLYTLFATTGSLKGLTVKTVIRSQHSSAIKTGLNQSNLLTVIAHGSSIYLYVNKQYVAHVDDSTSNSGAIGVYTTSSPKLGVDVAFSNAQVWML